MSAHTTSAAPPELERELLAGVRAGHGAACEALVRRHGATLRATARRLLADEAEADLALVEAFRRAFAEAHTCPAAHALASWLRGLLLAACAARCRTAPPRATLPMPTLLPRFDPSGTFAHATPAWTAPPDAPHLRAEVRRCIDELPATHRLVLLLADVERLGTAEIAAHLDLTCADVERHRHEARQALLALLQPRAS